MAQHELLVDAMWIGDREYHKGDLVDIDDADRAKELKEAGAIGDKGTIKGREEEAAQREEREARHQRFLTGQDDAFDAPDPEPKPEPERRPAASRATK